MWRVKCEMRGVKCRVASVKRKVWSVKCRLKFGDVGSVERGGHSVECLVLQCKVRNLDCEVWWVCGA